MSQNQKIILKIEGPRIPKKQNKKTKEKNECNYIGKDANAGF